MGQKYKYVSFRIQQWDVGCLAQTHRFSVVHILIMLTLRPGEGWVSIWFIHLRPTLWSLSKVLLSSWWFDEEPEVVSLLLSTFCNKPAPLAAAQTQMIPPPPPGLRVQCSWGLMSPPLFFKHISCHCGKTTQSTKLSSSRILLVHVIRSKTRFELQGAMRLLCCRTEDGDDSGPAASKSWQTRGFRSDHPDLSSDSKVWAKTDW